VSRRVLSVSLLARITRVLVTKILSMGKNVDDKVTRNKAGHETHASLRTKGNTKSVYSHQFLLTNR